MNFIVIIPARYFSARLPGKPLLDINGKPMILHVLDRVRKSNANRIIVATDHEKIAHVVKMAGGEICMTHTNHCSGTERLAEVIEKYGFNDKTVIVNVQGDEPFIPPKIIYQVAKNLLKHQVEMATIAVPIHDINEIYNQNIVKVIVDSEGYAIYFSRSAIPWNYISSNKKKKTFNYTYLRHLGIYSYFAGFIRRYVNWNPSPLEQIEMLEQLRVLWYREKIYVAIIQTIAGINTSVDTKEDLEQARNKFIFR